MRKTLPPSATESKHASGDAMRYDHDAYGVAYLKARQGGSGVLFGSDLKHMGSIAIEIKRGSLTRGLHHDWIHGDQTLLELEMSHAQFAQFITSPGNGTGTPVTLRYAMPRGARGEEMPGIVEIETKAKVMQREVRESASKAISDLAALVTQLGEKLDAGKVGVKELREIHRGLSIELGNLPANMEYTVTSAQETIEKAQNAAKIDVEAYVSSVTNRLGVESLRQISASQVNDSGRLEVGK